MSAPGRLRLAGRERSAERERLAGRERRAGRRRAPVTVALVALLAVCLAGVAAAAAGCGQEKPLTKVTLQLNWLHESEFAGYYVALDKGFYKDQGLDVTIFEGGPGTPARDRVVNGEVTFAVTSFAEQRDLVAAGTPSVAVMAAFQIPPSTIFALKSSGIHDPRDLVGKKVGVTTDYWSTILHETLAAANVDPTEVTEVRVKIDELDKLYNGTVDAWLGYAQDEPIRATLAGHEVNNIFPADFGVGGYEGLVIAMQPTIDASPEMVRAFVKASAEGWRYAIEHPDEAAKILAGWAKGTSAEFQKPSVLAVAPLVDTPQVPIGWIDGARWEQLMGDAYNADRPGFTMQFSPVTP